MHPRMLLAAFASSKGLLPFASTLLAHAVLLVVTLKTHLRHTLHHSLLTSHQLDHITRHRHLIAQQNLCSPESSPDVSGGHAQLCHTDRHGRKCCLCQDLSSGPSLCFLMGLFGPPGLCIESPTLHHLLGQGPGMAEQNSFFSLWQGGL